MKYDASGEFAVRPGKLTIIENDRQATPEKLELKFVEDQLLSMNCTIYNAFNQSQEKFEQDVSVLSLRRYVPIGQQIMMIQKLWEER
ncbi:MAG: hypothetical protein QNJ65_08130 [Xenococcaceae cyanobacterium MO_234.B1]|nr:hypothetical protein [Xenococcaceae cyanobacterium MO_234.B1]